MLENNNKLLDLAAETLCRAAVKLDKIDLRTVRAIDLKEIAVNVRLTLELLQAIKRA